MTYRVPFQCWIVTSKLKYTTLSKNLIHQAGYNKCMQRAALIATLVNIMTRMDSPHPLRVAIDGVDASGKTTLAKELALGLRSSGRQIIHASVDDFHNPARIRYQRGKLSPEGFFIDSYNYTALIETLLKPLGPQGDLRYRTASFDLARDRPLQKPLKTARADAILLMDGIFLLRPELYPFWDLTIYIDVDFANTITRGATRDAHFMGSFQEAIERYQHRYVPGQQRYLREVRPLDKADILIDNNNLEQPDFIRIPTKYVSVNNKYNDSENRSESPMNFPAPFYRWRPHPWHGLEVGPEPPERVYAYIEMTPFDTIKYEVHKETGYLHVDRPQRTSSLPPSLYGFIPRTYCDERVRVLSPRATRGDGDPLDICVISERPISRSEIFLNAKVVGVIQLLDHGEADDKIIAVLEKDHIYGDINDIQDVPEVIIERLEHYFRTYKMVEDQEPGIEIIDVFDAEKAKKIIQAAMQDYNETFGRG